ncbi:MAG: DMT family transporter [Bacteroidales bacterium]|jgi:drug/metabolite transporter (DMT)-like permease|nr:DMT family transporter [Bacteroidales bacterium]MDG2080596.1 DMT family transporter [Bacteroidales bacterium]
MNLSISKYTTEALLLSAAIIWGFAFVAQKAGMQDIGPLAFTGIRFILGAITLIPVIYITKKQYDVKASNNSIWVAGLISGIVLTIAAILQQYGIVYTTAGNAGFITSMYVILVPIISIFLKHKVRAQTWVGAVIAIVGFYLLSESEDLMLVMGDLLVLISALFWAIQVILAGLYSVKFNVIKLAAIQFGITGIICIILSLFFESYDWNNIRNALVPILYGGIMSVAVGFTLQLIAQRKANPAHSAIILSTEGLFAVVGGWLILNEYLTTLQSIGGVIILFGVVISQLGKRS